MYKTLKLAIFGTLAIGHLAVTCVLATGFVGACAATARIDAQLRERGLMLSNSKTHPNLKPFSVIPIEEDKVC